jgi:molybdopterin synthase sulfur carrier subunit
VSGQVNVRVRLFALARQLAHSDVIVLSLPESATVRDIRECLARTCPALAGLVPQMLIAIDSEYCDEATSVTAKSEVACIPPVSGG